MSTGSCMVTTAFAARVRRRDCQDVLTLTTAELSATDLARTAVVNLFVMRNHDFSGPTLPMSYATASGMCHRSIDTPGSASACNAIETNKKNGMVEVICTNKFWCSSI
eukprot:CAMPEP_0206496602 /NCGR_PEP_ID=MMETSP0324_2-20121206/49542_1 /ASSEMBLY_ACC=CAM_ASM_000836 /TAXON_ID=2866 /ORGANISM="Crypthecodinium cohnii, Strain Seligo" /LENGTH=107 /DNA_ID=CAMNT_0053981721 /DNA_START=10 /DNA_END=333 /DNA_ORIENTATION=+